jgi:P2 family phage contractile tail tube protein
MIPKVLKNFNLFVDGQGYAGRVAELIPPKLTVKTIEHRGGGMDSAVELDMGLEKLSCDFTLDEYDTSVLKLFGLVTGAPVQLTLRGGFDNEAQQVVPVTIQLRGAWRELDFGTWKAGDLTRLKVTVACRYYRLELDGTEMIEIDTVNMVRRIHGVDQLAQLRRAIGL